MEKYIYNEKNGLWYELQGEYYLPCLKLPRKNQPVGIWGQRHLRYIQKYQRSLYATLLTSGNLNSYLYDINQKAEDMFFRLVNEYAKKQNITEDLKATDQMKWVSMMNNIHNAVSEVVYAELIYTIK